MVGNPAASAVFDFENILPQLDFLPIAARRALDHAGLRLSLDAWRSLGLDDRCQLVAAGANDVVDSGAVVTVVRRASPPAQRIEIVGDPDPLAPPDGLSRLLEPVPLDARQWSRLRALDRYALAHVHRRSIARNDPSLMQVAYEDIVTGHLRSLRPPAPAPGASKTPSSMAAVVPPPPPLPRGEAVRAVRALEAAQRTAENITRSQQASLMDPSTTRPSQRMMESLQRAPAIDPLPVRIHQEELTLPLVPKELTKDQISNHLSEDGEARMVNVGAKPITERSATAMAIVRMQEATFWRLAQEDTPKGDVLAAARIAGIQAAKRTSELIPLCHMVALTRVEVRLDLDRTSSAVRVTATADAFDRTGVEMEAMVAASVASLTIYDMLKGLDRDISISDVKLLEKKGGRTGNYQRKEGG